MRHKRRINRARTVITTLFCGKKTRNTNTKTYMYKSLVQSITLPGSDVWDVNKSNRKKLEAMEMDFLRRSCGLSILDRVRNNTNRTKINMPKTITEEIEKKQLKWFGYIKWRNIDGSKNIGMGTTKTEKERTTTAKTM